MKKRTIFLFLILVCLLFVCAVSAAGGDASDPLISLSYLKNTFSPKVDSSVDAALAQSDEKLLGDAESEWNRILAAAEANAGKEHTAVFQEGMLKQGDILSGPTGLQVLVLAGSVKADFSSGAVVDATAGKEIASGTYLAANHRYLVAENTAALFSVVSKTAVLDYCGTYSLTRSAKPDYSAMAEALKSLSLLRGTGTGFGQGFDLERVPTRIEALVMLIRLLGEEKAALACTSPQPFADVDPWAVPYVAYAYEKGYSNGVGGGLFGSAMTASPQMYTEFVLRALGYSSTAQTDISDALVRAQRSGVLTIGEVSMLESTGFLRADIVYLSFYALGCQVSGSSVRLCDRLAIGGVFSAADYRNACRLVTSPRL